MEANFSLNDFSKQLHMIQELGTKNYSQLLPGLTDVNKDTDISRWRAVLQNIIHSMTPEERQRPDRLSPSRCRRISKGSGTPWEMQGQVLKEYFRAKEFADAINSMSMIERMRYAMSLNKVKPMVNDFDDVIDDDDDDLDY